MPAQAVLEGPSHVGVSSASQFTGVAPSVLMRLALIGDLSYTVSPDKRPLFLVRDLERVKEKLRPGPMRRFLVAQEV